MYIKWLGIPDTPDLTSSLGSPQPWSSVEICDAVRACRNQGRGSNQQRSVGFLETLNFSKKYAKVISEKNKNHVV